MNRLPVLDFARSASDRLKQRRLIAGGAGLFLGVELGVLAWQFQELDVAQSAIEEERRSAKRLSQPPEVIISKELGARLAAAQSMVNSLSVPWEGLLSALEVARGSKVVIESIRPDVGRSRVEIAAKVSEFPEIAAFIERLSASGTLEQVVLLSETPASEGQEKIHFVVTAFWRKEP